MFSHKTFFLIKKVFCPAILININKYKTVFRIFYLTNTNIKAQITQITSDIIFIEIKLEYHYDGFIGDHRPKIIYMYCTITYIHAYIICYLESICRDSLTSLSMSARCSMVISLSLSACSMLISSRCLYKLIYLYQRFASIGSKNNVVAELAYNFFL